LTVDNQTMKDDTVTIRYRDTMMQERVKVSEISSFLDTIIKLN
jgi:glycyl-tRNA synthetase